MRQIEIKKRQMEMASYVLGLIVLLILGNVLGDNGVAYAAIAVECFLLFWTFTGRTLADVLGKLLRTRSSKGQYKNAIKLRRSALVLEGFLGIVGSFVLFLLAESLGEGLFGLTYSVVIIKIMAPVIFVRTMSELLLGYFQGEGTELPSVISCVARQILILGFSLVFANWFKAYGSKVSSLLRQDNFTAMYAGMGVALAILMTEILILVFLFLVQRGGHRRERRNSGEGMRTTDTFTGNIAILCGNMLSEVLIVFLGTLPVWMGAIFFRKSITDIAELNDYGLLMGKFFPLVGVLIILGCMMLVGNCYKTASCVRREEQRFARGHFQGGLHMAVVYSVFITVFTAILAPQIAELLCQDAAESVEEMIRYGSVSIVLVIVAFYLSELLQMLGNRFYVPGLLAVYNLVYAATMALLLNGKSGVGALVYAALISGVVYVAGAGALLLLKFRLNVDWLQTVAVPAALSCAIGLIAMVIAKGITPHLGNLLTIVLCVLFGNVLYWVVLMLLRNFREQELSFVPCGKIIHIIGKMFRIY